LGQHRIRIGYGLYQGFNISANYFYKDNLNVGIGIGSHFGLPPIEDDRHFNVILEHNLHFGGVNKQNIKSWVFSQQLMYWEQGSNETWRILSPSITVGRLFALSKRIGLLFEVGPAFNLVLDVKREPNTEYSGWMWPVLYNGRIQVVYLF